MNIIETNLDFGNLSYGNVPNKIILHHAEASCCTVYDVHEWRNGNGWAGIGYHFFVDKQGNIYRGRPIEAIGSHCKGKNTGSRICAEGAYMEETMPEAQRQAIIQLCIYLCEQHGISENEIYGHRELGEINCPGDNYPLQIIKDSILSGNINIDKEECFDMKNLVIYSGDGDLSAAQLLSYKLSTSMISRDSYVANPIKAEHIFVIGGTWVPNKDAVLLSGSGRVETMNAVMDFIKSLQEVMKDE